MSRGKQVEKRFIERVKRYGPTQLERELGWHTNHFYKMITRRAGLRLAEVVEVLDHLREPLASLEPDRPQLPATVRFLSAGEELARRRRSLLPPLARTTAPDRLSRDELRFLDELRIDEPRSAANLAGQRAFEAAREGRARDAALLMARRGAALRLGMDYHGAHVCLWWALTRLPDDPDLWLRASNVLGDYGAYADALELSGQALNTFFRQGSMGDSARCLIDQGRYYYYLARFSAAHQAFATSLELLPADFEIHRIAALQCQGYTFFSEGNLEEAADSLAKAEAIGIPPGIFGGQLLWLQARIAAGRGRLDEALGLYHVTLVRLQASPANAALATCELVRLLLQHGKLEEATRRAQETLRYLQPCESPMVIEALRELAGVSLAGDTELTVPFLDRTITRIQQGLKKARQQAAAGLLITDAST